MSKDNMSDRKLFNKRDIWLFAGLAAVVLAVFAWNSLQPAASGPAKGQISVNGKVVRTVDLSKDGEFALAENPHIRFSVKVGGIAFIASDCPDQLCVRSGYLSLPGQLAACLPNRVSLSVTGAGELDGVTY